MDAKCSVCNEGTGYVLCDGCGKPVCFNCFHFANSRRLCTTCVKAWEERRRWQKYAEQYERMTEEEKAQMWATLSPEERSSLEEQLELGVSRRLQAHRRSAVRRYAWLVFPILGCVVVFLLFSNKELWKQASLASEKVKSQVASWTGSVKREVVDLASTEGSRPPVVSSPQPAPIQLIGQNLRRSGLPITAGNLRMKANPAGEGTIVYSPHYFGPDRRLAWIVINEQAYALTRASEEVTPSLLTPRAAPALLWKKTGLPRENALHELQKSLWEDQP
jgi:hypothetical protein